MRNCLQSRDMITIFAPWYLDAPFFNLRSKQDYKCVPVNKLTLTGCSKIRTPPLPFTTSPPPSITSLHQELFSTFTESSTINASVAIILIVLFGIVSMMLFKLRVFPELTSFRIISDDEIYRDEKTHTYIANENCGAEVVLTYKSLLPCGGVSIKNVDIGPMLMGEKGKEKFIKCNNKPFGLMTAVKRQSSFDVSCLTRDNTGRYEILLKNKIYLRHTLMERLNRFHTSLVNFIYKRDDDMEVFSSFFEFMITSLPETYEAVDVFYEKKIELKINSTDDKSEDHATDELGHTSVFEDFKSRTMTNVLKVIWFKRDGDQLKVVETDSREDRKNTYLRVDRYNNNSLIVNQACMGDAGRYVCIVVHCGGEITRHGWKLRVIPQESAYSELQQHRLDRDYVNISVVSDAMACLEKNAFVLLKGREGTGKSKMSLELASLLEKKGYLPFMVKSEEDISVEFDESKILYIFDQKSRMPHYRCDQLKRFLSNVTTHRLSCKAVFTCRSLHLLDLKDSKVIEEMTVDLDNRLTSEDKDKILHLYMNRNSVAIVPFNECNFESFETIKDKTKLTLDNDSIRMIVQTEPLQGFPLMARQFCEDRLNLHLGEKYFKNPPKIVIQKIKMIKNEASKGTASLHEVLRFVVLAYTTFSDNEKLEIHSMNYQKFLQIKSALIHDKRKYLEILIHAYDKITEDIKFAANSLVGDYLSCSDDVYEFIHPYYHKAVVLSSDDLGLLVIDYCRVEMILEYIKGSHYENHEEEMVLILNDAYIHVLCERLVKEYTECTTEYGNCKEANDICEYIYNYWIRNNDSKFCRRLFRHLDTLLFRDEQNDKDVVKVKVRPWHILWLIKDLTRNWNDLQIFSSDDIENIVVIFGLISLCQLTPPTNWEYVEDKKFGKAIGTLLDILCKRLSDTKESDGKWFCVTNEYCDDRLRSKLGASLDQHSNTFFHYLVLFNEGMACRILKCCCGHVKQAWKETNELNFRPIDIAVGLGKPELCKMFILAYNDIKFRVNKDKLMNTDRKRLRIILADNRHGKKTESTGKQFNISENFDSEIGRTVVTGNKEDYEELENILH